MDIKTGIRQLFKDNFTVSREWLDFYFSAAYDERCALTAEQDGAIASSLMLDSYSMKLGDSFIDTGYIFGASTARRQRGKGLMSALIKDALAEARNRGHALVNLIPASDRLYFYYERFGFTTVFYSERQRYTSAHRFDIGDRYHRVNVDYDDFNRLELMRRATVIHSRDDFDYAVSDTSLDGGSAVAVAGDGRRPMGRDPYIVPKSACPASILLFLSSLPYILSGYCKYGCGGLCKKWVKK